ncbi:MAG: GntR family transcriptional regulator [Anaerovoracaceae bacterium]|jgi:GntR family transcriptional regulator
MEWKFNNGTPIYAQIVTQLSQRIASGAYAPGERLPSVRDLAADAGVNPNTMQRALAELERRELVHSERTSGRFITDDQDTLRSLHTQLAERYISELFQKLYALGMTDGEIITQIMERQKDMEGQKEESHGSH